MATHSLLLMLNLKCMLAKSKCPSAPDMVKTWFHPQELTLLILSYHQSSDKMIFVTLLTWGGDLVFI